LLPELDANVLNKNIDGKDKPRQSIFQYPALILGIIAMFFHIGTQMISLATIIDYAGTMGLVLDGPAKNFPSYTMTFTFMGYLLGIILIPKYLNQRVALLICACLNLVLSFCVIFVTGPVRLLGMETDISIWFLVLMGLPNALLYAGIWPLAINGLGRLTNLGSAFLVMALSGSAILPLLFSYFVELHLADSNSAFLAMKTAYWIFVPCFIYIIWYAFQGYRIKSWRSMRVETAGFSS